MKKILLMLLIWGHYADAQLIGGSGRGRGGGGTTMEVDPTVPSYVKEIQESDLQSYQNAAATAHSHANKSVLDFISAADTANWYNAAQLMHSHVNKSVLDGITAGKVTNWDAVYSASSTYTTASNNQTFTNKSGNISQWTNDATYITAVSTNTLTNKSGNISQWTNNTGYITGITGVMVNTALGYTAANAASLNAGNLFGTAPDNVISANIQRTADAAATYLTIPNAASTYQTLANLSTDMTASATKYPSVNAVNTALGGYVTTATASGYQTTANLSADLTASATKYPSVNAVNTGLALKANSASPTFTGTPLTPTATAGTNTTQIASTAFVTGALGNYETASTATGKYQLLSNLSTDLTASASKYPSVNAVNTGLAAKEPAITAGTTTQYWRGDKTWQTLPTTPTSADYVTTNSAQTGLTGTKSWTDVHTFAAAPVFSAGASSGGDILPTANVSYNLGSGSFRWNNLYTGSIISGGNLSLRVGSNTTSFGIDIASSGNRVFNIFPTTQNVLIQNAGTVGTDLGGDKKLQVKDGSIALPTISSGIYMTAPNGNIYKLTVSNTGTAVFTLQ